MNKHSIYVQFMSDRSDAQLQSFLIKSLEKAGCTIVHLKHTSRPAGRPKVNRPKVKGYLMNSCEAGQSVTISETMNATGLSEQAVGRVFRELVREGHLIQHYTVGSPATYEITLEKWLVD